jgi:hypothetical protein
MEVVLVQAGERLSEHELDCDLDLISRCGTAADGADGSYAVTAPQTIGLSRRHLPETDRFTGLFSKE